jgi:Zn-dependent protease with chaperone function
VSRAAMRTARRSLRFRALVALGLLVGFYALAFGIVAVIAALLLWSIRGGHFRVNQVGLLLAAVAILRGVLFLDRGRPEAPPISIELRPSEEPQLWAEVRALAEAVRAPRPDTVYLVADVNAFVYQDSRLLGLRPGRMVLGIGVGLLAILRVDELRAVLGHELGHLGGGDTRYGPVVYRVKESIQRTITHLRGGLLAKPFAGYFRLFMRLTMSVSRRQELAADVNAVRLGGRDAAATALERVAVAAGAFDFLVQQYAAPLWQARCWPVDLYQGLRRLLAEPDRAEQLQALRAALLAAPGDRWDSHPPLGERLGFIASLRGGPATTDQRAARSLLGNPAATERRMAEQLAAFATKGVAATPLTWDQAAVQVYGPALEQRAGELAAATVALCDGQGTGELARTLEALAAGEGDALAYYLQPDLEQVPIQERRRAATQVLGWYLRAALATELVRRHGCRWAASWAEGVGVDGWYAAGALEDLVQRAMRGPEGVAAVRATLGLEHPVRYPGS